MERRLRHAPGHAPLGAVLDLPSNHELRRLFEEAIGGRPHHQRWHQVLEHRARPRDQCRAALDRRERTAELQPVRDGNVAFGDRDEAGEASLGREKIVAIRVQTAVRHPVADREEPARRIEEKGEIGRRDHLIRAARQIRQLTEEVAGGLAVPSTSAATASRPRSRSSALAALARSGTSARAGSTGSTCSKAGAGLPCATRTSARSRSWLSRVARAASLHSSTSPAAPSPPAVGERARDVDHRVDAIGEQTQALRPLVWCCWRGGERGEDLVERLVEVLPADGLRSTVIAPAAPPIRVRGHRVLDARQNLAAQHRAIDELAASVRERDQMADEVAAVDRRYVRRIERTQRACVVPVVEVAAKALERLQRRERRLEARRRVAGPDPAEVARRDHRKQIQSDVGGRRPVRHHGLRILLEIVGRQRVILRVDEGLEEPPRPSRDGAEIAPLDVVERMRADEAPREAHRPRDQRRQGPEQNEWQRERTRRRSCDDDDERRHARENQRTSHVSRIAAEREIGAGFHLRRRRPLEEPPARHVETDDACVRWRRSSATPGARAA